MDNPPLDSVYQIVKTNCLNIACNDDYYPFIDNKYFKPKQMKFNPTDDRILIKPTPDDKIRAGLQLSDTDVEPKSEGTIVAMGTGVPLHNVKINLISTGGANEIKSIKELVQLLHEGTPMKVKVGDLVLYGKYAGTKIVLNDEPHVIVRYADIFGILTEE